ncbi:hypothetical protein GCM10011363_28420 [Marivita lacus]|uniref:Uncharacterized protein n=1 Tax=Marivita lacus TaxID=1323742 RepID=A0ABQ1KVT3_9RHOB|nr:hypothetical protein GCM10011363_28420 [Marivita lacus]
MGDRPDPAFIIKEKPELLKDAENVSRIPSIEAAADQQVPGQLGVEGGASALH